MTQAALEFRSVHASYGKIEVIHGVDLCVEPGKVLALFGPNGAGKSTLLSVAGGGLRPTSGSVFLFGRDTSKSKSFSLAREGLCWIPEGRGIFPNLTVAENLLMWTYEGGNSRSQIEEIAFGRFPVLARRRKQIAGSLSGGEQQMLALARAIGANPKVLLVDELSMGLAPKIVAELYGVIGELAASGTAVLLVEQFIRSALLIATEAALIFNGTVSLVGDPDEVAVRAYETYLSGETG